MNHPLYAKLSPPVQNLTPQKPTVDRMAFRRQAALIIWLLLIQLQCQNQRPSLRSQHRHRSVMALDPSHMMAPQLISASPEEMGRSLEIESRDSTAPMWNVAHAPCRLSHIVPIIQGSRIHLPLPGLDHPPVLWGPSICARSPEASTPARTSRTPVPIIACRFRL